MDNCDNYLYNLGQIIFSLKSLPNWDYREIYISWIISVIILLLSLNFEEEMVASLKLKGSAEDSMQMSYAIVIILFELWDVSSDCEHHKLCHFNLICYSVSMVIMVWENAFRKKKIYFKISKNGTHVVFVFMD